MPLIMSLAAGTILGQYKIRSPLGAGGMGEVYRAHRAISNLWGSKGSPGPKGGQLALYLTPSFVLGDVPTRVL